MCLLERRSNNSIVPFGYIPFFFGSLDRRWNERVVVKNYACFRHLSVFDGPNADGLVWDDSVSKGGPETARMLSCLSDVRKGTKTVVDDDVRDHGKNRGDAFFFRQAKFCRIV